LQLGAPVRRFITLSLDPDKPEDAEALSLLADPESAIYLV